MALGGGLVLLGLLLLLVSILLLFLDYGGDVDVGPYSGPVWLFLLLLGIIFVVIGCIINYIEGATISFFDLFR